MAFQFAPLLMKAYTGAKALMGGAAAKAAATKTAGGIAGGLSGGARMASTKLAQQLPAAVPAFNSGIGKTVFGNMSKGEIVGRLAPDAFFGVVGGAMTPGDLADKLVAGTAVGVGGGMGGLALSRGATKLGINGMPNYLIDMAGSYGGDFAGMAVGDAVMRGKDKLMGGEGLTPYERMSAQQQRELAEQIRRQTAAAAGLMPGYQDQFLYENGLG